MIYTLTLNPCIDYDLSLNNFIEGEMNLSKSTNIRTAGKGINVSKVLNNLGIESIALGFIAGFMGDYVKNSLTDDGIKNDFIKVAGETRINVKLNNNDKETEIQGVSPFISEKDMDLLFQKLINITNNDWLIMSGSIPDSLATDIYKQINNKCVNKPKIVLDTRGNLIKENLCPSFLAKPNISELEAMFNKKINNDKDIVRECQYLLDCGVENILVSKGSKGAVLVSKDCAFSAKVPKGKLIKSTGAGDSMVACFVAANILGNNKKDSFKMAVAGGSATAYSRDLCTNDAVMALMEDIQIDDC